MTRLPARSPELELAGTDEFGAILGRTRRQLRNSIAAAAKAGKPPRETTRDVRINARWGWTYWQVDAEEATTLAEVGFIRPRTDRSHRTLLLANSANGGWLRTLAGLGGAGLGAIGGMAGFAMTTPALAIAGGGAALGVGAASLVRHRLDRWQNDSVRIQADQRDPGHLDRLPATRAARTLNHIAFKISDFQTHMATVASQHGTDPVPLPLDHTPDYLLDEIHQAVWDLASEQTNNTDGEILTELWRVGKAIDDAIDAAWSTWHAAQVPIPPPPPVQPRSNPTPTPPPQPERPVVRRPTVDRLSKLTGTVRDAHTASTKAAQEVRQINRPDR